MSHLKVITILLGGIYMPFAMFIGYCFGAGYFLRGTIALILYLGLTVADGCIFWQLIERRNDT